MYLLTDEKLYLQTCHNIHIKTNTYKSYNNYKECYKTNRKAENGKCDLLVTPFTLLKSRIKLYKLLPKKIIFHWCTNSISVKFKIA